MNSSQFFDNGNKSHVEPLYYDQASIRQLFPDNDWRSVVFREFESTLMSNTRPFPCVFGVAGMKTNQLRFVFLDPLNAETLAKPLATYLAKARTFGQNTSLVVFSRPGPVLSLNGYWKRFWSLLRDLSEIDAHPWPSDIPEQIDTPMWEFSFAGEPIFVVCNTPAHVQRQSRRATTFMITFQPRWVFDNILGKDAASQKALEKVRERLAAFDLIEASPALGHYGDAENREFSQYFLGDDNKPMECPFHTLKTSKEQAA